MDYDMDIMKFIKDWVIRVFLGKDYLPSGLTEMSEYFRRYKVINFENHQENGLIIAVSTDFKYGSIITSGKNFKEVDHNIRDAIFTSFEVPSVYADKFKIEKLNEHNQYALA